LTAINSLSLETRKYHDLFIRLICILMAYNIHNTGYFKSSHQISVIKNVYIKVNIKSQFIPSKNESNTYMIFTDSNTPSIKYYNPSMRCTRELVLFVILYVIICV